MKRTLLAATIALLSFDVYAQTVTATRLNLKCRNTAALSGTDKGAFWYRCSDHALLFSSNGGAFAAIGGGGSTFSGGTITTPILAADGTAAAPSYSFTNATGVGLFNNGSNSLGFATNSAAQATLNSAGTLRVGAVEWGNYAGTVNYGQLNSSGISMQSSMYYAFSNGSNGNGPIDTSLRRGGAGILSQSNGVNAQKSYIYNTTDSDTAPVNYERMEVGWNANQMTISLGKGGTGAFRDLVLGGGSTNDVYLGTSAFGWVSKNGSTGSLLPSGNNAQDVGGASNRVRTAYVATSYQGASTKTLTETVATGFVKVGIASGSHASGWIDYEIYAADATDQQSRTGALYFSGVNNAGTITMQLGRSTGGTVVDNTTDIAAVSLGTLTNTFTSTQAANEMTFLANATSSLTQTTLQINYVVHITSGTATVTGL